MGEILLKLALGTHLRRAVILMSLAGCMILPARDSSAGCKQIIRKSARILTLSTLFLIVGTQTYHDLMAKSEGKVHIGSAIYMNSSEITEKLSPVEQRLIKDPELRQKKEK